jgi:hypothetical protein
VWGREGEFLAGLRCGVRWEDEEAETRRLRTAGRRLVEFPRAGLCLLTIFCNGVLLAIQPFLFNKGNSIA